MYPCVCNFKIIELNHWVYVYVSKNLSYISLNQIDDQLI